MKQKTDRRKPRLSHRKRFHLLHDWLVTNYKPCKAADVGGGKGLLAYLLNKSGWNAVVIDPFNQELPRTFKDLTKTRTTLVKKERESVTRVTDKFKEEMAQDYNLLIGLHAHGSNMKIINACKKYGKDFVLLPCCVVGEPIIPQQGINWLDSLVDYAKQQGFDIGKAELNFKGQNIVIYNKKAEETV